MASLITSVDIGTFLAAADKAAARALLDLGNAATTSTSTGGNGAADGGKAATYDYAGNLRASRFLVTGNGYTASISGSILSGDYDHYSPNSHGVLALTSSSTGIPDNLVTSNTKTTPVDADSVLMTDSAATGTPAKRVTFANLWTWITTKLGGNLTIAGTKTWSGTATFSSTTRPTSSGTGTPASNSLVTLSDVETRGGRWVTAHVSSPEYGPLNNTALTTSMIANLNLEIGTWDIEALIAVSSGSTFAGSRQKLIFTGTSSSFNGVVYQVNDAGINATSFPNARQVGTAINAEISSNTESITTLRIGRLVATSSGYLAIQIASGVAIGGINPNLLGYLRARKV